MSRVSSKEKYVVAVYELFRKKGLNMTMDEIADHLKLTKKTLYNNFKSKEELMRTVMQHVLGEIEFKINLALSQGRDAIEALYHTSDMMNRSLAEIGPVLLSDSSKYLPDLKLLDHTNRMSFYSRIIAENIDRGMSEGLYRVDFNKELVTLFFTSAMSRIYSWNGAYKYLKDPYVFHSELVRYHLESIVNDEGRKVLSEMVKKRS
ncbi:MAG: TetR/AcrR family transcriptional regulator [Bacteroidales bacterium]|jgi:AcrR family transcriptional regulator|nr:TetR/AcrR family transcriptional regulator [Bacteroidales bacterium]